VALVIGNDAYETLPSLNNANKDARGMAAKLRQLGFDVILKLNIGRRTFGRAIAEFENKLGAADVGLVFYAGHGIQAGGKNYLIPADARIEVEDDLPYEGVDAGHLLEAMKRAGSRLNIVIIDACRNNPLPRRSRSLARGLTVTAVPLGIKGTAIVYSAAPGQTAQDGPKGGHGVFTGALLAVLDRPGLTLEQVFKETAKRVALATNGKQDPWINSSVKGDFIFNPGAVPVALAKPKPGGDEAELLFWDSIKSSTNRGAFQAYLQQYPTGIFTALARLKLEELRPPQFVSRPPPSPDVVEIDANHAAVKEAAIRAAPSPTSRRLGKIAQDQGIAVTGRVAGGKWLRVERNNGGVGYILASLLRPVDGDEGAGGNKARDGDGAVGGLQVFDGLWNEFLWNCGANIDGNSRNIEFNLSIYGANVDFEVRESTATAVSDFSSNFLDRFSSTIPRNFVIEKKLSIVAGKLILEFDAKNGNISGNFDNCPMILTRK
jgi:hypothetical protein